MGSALIVRRAVIREFNVHEPTSNQFLRSGRGRCTDRGGLRFEGTLHFTGTP
jgi:hypothetical protein